jgi:hypothetical protein
MLSLGDVISLNNGMDGAAASSVFALVKCFFDNGFREFVVPVFEAPLECTANFSSSHRVNGFVGVVITGVSLGSPRRVDLQTVFRTDVLAQPGTGGCP